MGLEHVWCPVISTHVTRVTNFEGEVTSVICPDYDRATGLCRCRTAVLKGGPLARLLDRMSEDTLAEVSNRCLLGGPNR
jgi:hypothetical protein